MVIAPPSGGGFGGRGGGGGGGRGYDGSRIGVGFLVILEEKEEQEEPAEVKVILFPEPDDRPDPSYLGFSFLIPLTGGFGFRYLSFRRLFLVTFSVPV